MVQGTLSQVSPATIQEWRERVARREARVGIVGLGYVGLPLTLLFADAGLRVTGFDIDRSKVEKLNRGESYLWRIENEHIATAQRKGFVATDDFSAVRELDAVLICVPTPLTDHHVPDLSFVESTIRAIAPHLRAGQLVVLESTTYPGTTEEIIATEVAKHGHRVLRDEGDALDGVMVAFSPEREDPGNMETARRDVPKVLGGCDRRATDAAEALYGSIFKRTVPVSSPATAEMTKLLENIYRAVNIAMVNEMKQLCLRMGIDIWEVIDAAATKPFGFQAFYPGPGIGGHCIPVDPFYLTWKAKEFGFPTRFIQLAGEVNEEMPRFVVLEVGKALNERAVALKGAKVLVLGVAYKRDVDDLRESPALTIIELLQGLGVDVSYNDPFFPEVGRGRKYDLQMKSAPLDDLGQYDCVLIATDHSAYDYERVVAESKLVVDARNATRGIMSDKIVRC
ncbi:MAG: nucleotide sugar dehydrogenase [Acidobacteria bacterium]|nr:nucleotide sugar dehydrogenase [Acidobacteriota bacterium]